MTEDFALIDFALSARSPAEIAEAIGRMRMDGAARSAAPSPRRRGLLSRLLGRDRSGGGDRQSPLRIQPAGTLAPPPLARVVLTDMGYAAAHSPVRLTAPVGVAGLTLIEFRDGDGQTSPFCEALSALLAGDEVFYFRHSGTRHPGAHYAFHVYLDGRATRCAASISAEGTAPEAKWKGIDSGMPHPLEADSLPAPGMPKSEIMTPVRQAAILEALGVDPDALFLRDPELRQVILELSEEPEGRPVSEARAIVQEMRRAAMPPPEPLHAEPEAPPPADIPPGSEEVSPDPVVAAPPHETTLPEEPARQAEAAAASHADETADATEPASPATAGPDATAGLPPGSRPPWEEQVAAPSWEEEVTALLVAAVESALPPEEQVRWLDTLTRQLEGGDIDGALDEAQRVIAAGRRPDGEKAASAARLAELFGRDPLF